MSEIERLKKERTDLKNKYYEESKALTEKIRDAQYLESKSINAARREERAIIRKRNELIKKEYDRGEITQKKLGAKYNLSGARVHDIIGEVERRERAQIFWEEKCKKTEEIKL
jgi:Mor family transcriptional regulator